jgi:AMP-polyphosphate phosphotransferase
MPRDEPRTADGNVSRVERRLLRVRDELLTLQTLLRSKQTFAVAVIVTGIPAAGRTETVNRLLEWLDPKYVAVHACDEESANAARPPMWRYWQTLPARGRINLYFGGWYGEYIGDMLHRSKRAQRRAGRALERILQLETMLSADGIRTLKVFLQIPQKLQHRRLAKLREQKLTRWRVTREDLWLARHYDRVQKVAARTLKASDHNLARWHVIDGTDENVRELRVGELLRDTLREGFEQPVVRGRLASSPAEIRSLPRSVKRVKLDDDVYEKELETLQGRLALLARASRFGKHGLVVAFEGMDAAGKGGAIRRLTHALDARHYTVIPVSAPSEEERSHPYLWRFWRSIPSRGRIAIFDRSWYGRVLVERVRGFARAPDWKRAYGEINEFERQLREHGLIVAKFWMNLSKTEQLERFKERQQDPLKRFKVDPEDWVNRNVYDAYREAAAEMIARTDTPEAKWTIVPADDKKQARLQVLRTLCETIEARLSD